MSVLASSYRLGQALMDRDHEFLFDLFLQLEAAASAQNQVALAPILTALQRKMLSHLADEETLMRASDYPELNKHQQEHRELRKQLECLVNVIHRGCTSAASYGAKLLAMWMLWHLDGSDRALAEYLRHDDPMTEGVFQCNSQGHWHRQAPAATVAHL